MTSIRPRFKVPALYCLLALALMYTLYFTKTLLMPLVVALLFALLLNPSVKTLQRFHIPRAVSAFVLLAIIGVPFTLLGIQLIEPTQKWISRLPELSATINKGLDTVTETVAPPAAEPPPKKKGFFSFFSSDDEVTAPPPSPDTKELSQRLMRGGLDVVLSALSATPLVITQFLTFVMVTLFLLIFGPNLYTQATAVLPQVKDKENAAKLADNVQQELSRYILTVSLINSGLGIVVAVALWLAGVEDALLWGVMVGLLNFAPYVGALLSVCILTIAGLVQYGFVWGALLPAGIYFTINMIEAQVVTPLVLGQHMRLNPLMLVLWLIVWAWIWGAMGVLLAVPLLVCLKLVAKQLNILTPWVALIES